MSKSEVILKKLIKGNRYTLPNSSLVVKVLSVFHETDKYIKAKVSLSLKTGEIYSSKPFTTKLQREVVDLWERA